LVPWEHSTLTSKFCFTAPQPAGPSYDQQIEMALWASVKDSTNPDVLRSYLQRYPEGAFSALAHALLAQTLRQAEAGQAAREERRRRDEQALKSQQLTCRKSLRLHSSKNDCTVPHDRRAQKTHVV
jgi:hypothetical protein